MIRGVIARGVMARGVMSRGEGVATGVGGAAAAAAAGGGAAARGVAYRVRLVSEQLVQ